MTSPTKAPTAGLSEARMRSGVSMPIEALYAHPHVLWTHVDGPYMTWAGNGHWLTWSERVRLYFGWTTIEDIAQARFPYRREWFQRSQDYPLSAGRAALQVANPEAKP